MANIQNKFPPKASQKLTYPAIYNLDEYDIPPGNDYEMGTYFNIQFGGWEVNAYPDLPFGKHYFNIKLISYGEGSQYLPLKSGSRLRFELKDTAGTVIYSDMTSIFTADGFTGYIWIKQDPIRTFENIKEGWGYFRIVGILDTPDPAWRKRYNVRVTHPVWIGLYQYNEESQPTQFIPNTSPVILQKHTGSLGSGSGNLIVSEKIEMSDSEGILKSYIQVSASSLRTFSGEIKDIRVEYKFSSSANDFTNPQLDYGLLSTHTLGNETATLSDSYEDDIDPSWSAGINSETEYWDIPISAAQIPLGGWDSSGTNKVKFKFKFLNNAETQQYAKDYHTSANLLELEYPSNTDEWLVIEGSPQVTTGISLYSMMQTDVVESSLGHFSFESRGFNKSNQSVVGQTFDSSGNPKQLLTADDRDSGAGRTE